MNNEKTLKITIECEGKETQVLEAKGIAATLLTEGNDSEHHGLKTVICGHMSIQDLIHLHSGVGEKLIEALEKAVVSRVSLNDISRIFCSEEDCNESEG